MLEGLLGLLLLLWPGLWQEAVHPLAMGTVFYPLQAVGALWIGRAGLTLAAARAPRWAPWAAGAWLVELPAAAVLLLRTPLLGPWASATHLGRIALAVLALWLCRRRAAQIAADAERR